MEPSPIVIIGSGLAGYGLLRELRKRDAAVPVTLVTADDGRVYAKPNLSNALAQGRAPGQLASETAEQMAARHDARILTRIRVRSIDPARKTLHTDRGEIAYGRLVLALGADPIPHGLEGGGASEVLSVNDLEDYARFRAALEGRRHVAILGGGLIGCEFANDLAAAGHAVTVVHLGPHPLERLLPPEAGAAFAAGLARQGVVWRFGRRAVRAERTRSGLRLGLDDGSALEADLALAAIGLKPRTALARAAGLRVDRGIVVDRELATSVPDVYALGDCAEVAGHVLPYVQPLLIQARALAATLTGEPTAVRYPAMPVVVKTPASPAAVLPAAPGAAGRWQVQCSESGVCALCQDADGRLLGFALTGAEAGKRALYAREAPALLG